MSMHKVLTNDGIREFNEFMIMQLEEIAHERVFFPWHDEYDEQRMVWNGLINHHPAAIVKCKNTEEVVEVVRFCNNYDLKITVRGGGHHITGSAVQDDHLVIDLSLLNSVEFDLETETVVAEGGATWKDVDEITQEFGYAVPGGVVSDTGIAGLTLGGGYGWLRGKYGLSSDNLIGCQIVQPDGKVIWIDAAANPDLFWAIRGAGSNFGVITRFKYTAHHIGSELYMNAVFYKTEKPEDLLRIYQQLTAELAPEITSMVITGRIPKDEFFPEDHYGENFIAILAVYAGDPEDGRQEMEIFQGLGEEILDISDTYPYIEIQQFFDEDYPEGGRYYWSSVFANDLHEELIDTLTDLVFSSPSPLTTVDLWHMHGKSRQQVGSVPNRGAKFLIGIESNWFDSKGDDENIDWNKHVRQKLEQVLQNGSGYTNFSSSDDPLHRKQKDFGQVLEKIKRLQEDFDPDTRFSRL